MIVAQRIPECRAELEWFLATLPDHVRSSRDINLGVTVEEVLASLWANNTQKEVQIHLGLSQHNANISKFLAAETGHDVRELRGSGSGTLKGKFLILIKSLMRDSSAPIAPVVKKKTVERSASDIKQQAWAKKLFVALSLVPWCNMEGLTEVDTLAVIKQLNLV